MKMLVDACITKMDSIAKLWLLGGSKGGVAGAVSYCIVPTGNGDGITALMVV